jgi:hypothetical protein
MTGVKQISASITVVADHESPTIHRRKEQCIMMSGLQAKQSKGVFPCAIIWLWRP